MKSLNGTKFFDHISFPISLFRLSEKIPDKFILDFILFDKIVFEIIFTFFSNLLLLLANKVVTQGFSAIFLDKFLALLSRKHGLSDFLIS